MEISDDDIKLITRIILERLGPDLSRENLNLLVADAISKLAEQTKAILSDKGDQNLVENNLSMGNISPVPKRKLIINAFGPEQDSLQLEIISYLNRRDLILLSINVSTIDEFKSVIAIVDYSGYNDDPNALKFELSEICAKHGFKALIQDSAYYMT